MEETGWLKNCYTITEESHMEEYLLSLHNVPDCISFTMYFYIFLMYKKSYCKYSNWQLTITIKWYNIHNINK